MQFELNAFYLVFGEILSIAFFGAFPSQFGQVVRFKFDTIQTVITTQFLDLLLGFFFRQHHITVFVTSELIE